MANRTVWTGSASDLWLSCSQASREGISSGGGWAKSPQTLDDRLRRAQTLLRVLPRGSHRQQDDWLSRRSKPCLLGRSRTPAAADAADADVTASCTPSPSAPNGWRGIESRPCAFAGLPGYVIAWVINDVPTEGWRLRQAGLGNDGPLRAAAQGINQSQCRPDADAIARGRRCRQLYPLRELPLLRFL
jgi:hypothetical protein